MNLFKLLVVISTLTIGNALYASCPVSTRQLAWPDYASVYYGFQVGQGGPPPNSMNPLAWNTLGGAQDDIAAGLSLWNIANSSSNVSYVQFSAGGNAPLNFYAYQVNYPDDPYSPNYAAKTSMSYLTNAPDVLVQADVTLYYYSTSGGSLNIDPNGANYDSFVAKNCAA